MMQTGEAVETAALWLDSISPGWADEVDLDSFDISNPLSCIAGQVKPFGGSYDSQEYRTPYSQLVNAVYCHFPDDMVDQIGETFSDRLYQDDWVEVIRRRKS